MSDSKSFDHRSLDHSVEANLDRSQQRRPPGRTAAILFLVSAVSITSLIGGVVLTTRATDAQDVRSATGLSKTISIHGLVVGPDEQPIGNAEVYVNVSERFDSIKLGESNQDGTFQFDVPRMTLTRTVSPGVALGQCQASLLAVHADFGAAWALLPSENGGRFGDMLREYEVTLRMVDDLPVKGRIVDDAGKPVAGAVVSVIRIHDLRGNTWKKMLPAIESLDVDSMSQQEMNVNNWFSYQYPGALNTVRATTNNDGDFTLRGIGSDRAVQLAVSGPGIQRPRNFVVLVREDATEFARLVRDKYPAKSRDGGVRLFGIHPTITVQRARTIAGTVRDATTGEPVENAEVYVLGGSRERTVRLNRVRTDRHGRYRFVSEQPAEITVVVDGDDHLYLPVSRTLTDIVDVGETSADFELPRGVLIQGTVVEANTDRPIASQHRNFCDDVQPGPLLAGYAYYYPIEGNEWLGNLGQGLVSIPFEYCQSNHRRYVNIDAEGKFQMAVPPGKGVVLIEARPPQSSLSLVDIPKVPYLTLGGNITGTTSTETVNSKRSFPGLQKPISANKFHVAKLIDPTRDTNALDLRFEVTPAPSQAIRFVDPDGKPIAGVQVAGLVPPAQFGQTRHLSQIEIPDSEALAFDVSFGKQRKIFAISKDGKFGIAKSITVTGEAAITLPMQPTATLKFRLVDQSSQAPLVGYQFGFTYGNEDADSLRLNARDHVKFTSDKGGNVTITAVIANEPMTLFVKQNGYEKRSDGKARKNPPIQIPESLKGLTLATGEQRNLGTLNAN